MFKKTQNLSCFVTRTMVSRQLSYSSSSLKTITMGGGPFGGPFGFSSSFPSITTLVNENVVHSPSASHCCCCRRRFTSTNTTQSASREEQPAQQNEKKNLIVLYEGPFANMALRLKRISITTAIASIVGVVICPYPVSWQLVGLQLLQHVGPRLHSAFVSVRIFIHWNGYLYESVTRLRLQQPAPQ
jgi:hypothetical protein